MKKIALSMVPLVLIPTLTACAVPSGAATQVSATARTSVEDQLQSPVQVSPLSVPQGTLTAAPTATAAGEALVEAGAAVPQAAGPPEDMFFEDYGNNPFVNTAQDNLSTFAVDVDTGSYTLTRSYLNDGFLPPPEAVRLEEFVNYFDQDYPLPQQGQAFNIAIDAAPTPFSAQGNIVMRVGIQGYDIAPEARPDALLIFVIDVSGSMDMENRLGAVKEALSTLTGQLRPSDQVGIVVYGSQGRVLLEPTPVSQSQTILQAISLLQPDGSTNAEQGLSLAYQMATAHFDSARLTRIILCSDGVANVGATGPDSILETVRQQAREGITLTTVGFGMGNYNDVLMEQLADDGDGQYFYVDTQSEARRIFVERLTGTLQNIARDAKIQVEFNPETVTYYRLMGYENRDVADEDFRNDAVDAGEVGAGHNVTALYEIVPAEGAQGLLATVRLRWEDPATGEIHEIAQDFTTEETAASFDAASPRFKLDVAVAAFADVLGEGAWYQTASLFSVQDVALTVADELPQDADVQEFVNLLSLAAQIPTQ